MTVWPWRRRRRTPIFVEQPLYLQGLSQHLFCWQINIVRQIQWLKREGSQEYSLILKDRSKITSATSNKRCLVDLLTEFPTYNNICGNYTPRQDPMREDWHLTVASASHLSTEACPNIRQIRQTLFSPTPSKHNITVSSHGSLVSDMEFVIGTTGMPV